MESAKRIEKILALFQEIWLKYPDLHFNQLIYDLQCEFSSARDNRYTNTVLVVETIKLEDGREREIMRVRDMPDLFHVEDDEFINFLTNKKIQLDAQDFS